MLYPEGAVPQETSPRSSALGLGSLPNFADVLREGATDLRAPGMLPARSGQPTQAGRTLLPAHRRMWVRSRCTRDVATSPLVAPLAPPRLAATGTTLVNMVNWNTSQQKACAVEWRMCPETVSWRGRSGQDY